MNVIEIPFNKFLGLQKADTDDEFILKLEERKEYLNHLGTLHASTLFALAEATSGEYLLNQFKDYELNIIPVVRKVEIKYSKPGNGTVYSKADFVDTNTIEIIDELSNKKRVIIKVKVDIYNENLNKIMTSIFDWFIALN
ncbi:MAG: YiiD C-terminal domain-containing protein [Bacteroidetes bacterium]|nr:YiiD C-terminal domain-containing protein [Bacteroidota bacterium]